jgi:hypothetical protein
MTLQPVGSFGILCSHKSGDPPFSEQHYCRRLSQASTKYGISVVVLCPQSIQTHHQISGYIFRQGGWKKAIVPLPDIIYDRCFHKQKGDTRAISKMLTSSSIHKPSILWARGLPGKWQVYNQLKMDPTLFPHLPLTSYYSGSESLIENLITYQGQVFLKPQAGSQGKRTLHIQTSQCSKRFIIKGRDHHNKEFIQILDTETEGLTWVHQFICHRPYIIQPYLHLLNKQGHPFDIRVLMQKDGEGRWMLTGMAVRTGQHGGITSNLHGGGTATSVLPFLTQEFGTAPAEQMMTVLHKLSSSIPPILESYFGRLGELGIDYGIDKEGKVWILEANSKPGRTSFDHIGNPTIAILANENPLRYARYLLLRQLRRVNS